jgi:hypothetical protein
VRALTALRSKVLAEPDRSPPSAATHPRPILARQTPNSACARERSTRIRPATATRTAVLRAYTSRFILSGFTDIAALSANLPLTGRARATALDLDSRPAAAATGLQSPARPGEHRSPPLPDRRRGRCATTCPPDADAFVGRWFAIDRASGWPLRKMTPLRASSRPLKPVGHQHVHGELDLDSVAVGGLLETQQRPARRRCPRVPAA